LPVALGLAYFLELDEERSDTPDKPSSSARQFIQGAAIVQVADAQARYQEYSRAGAKITQEPHVQPYGIRDFHLRDPNGLLSIFGQDVDWAKGLGAAGTWPRQRSNSAWTKNTGSKANH